METKSPYQSGLVVARVREMKKVRKSLFAQMGLDRVKRAFARGDPKNVIIAQINERIDYYGQLRDKDADVMALADNTGFQKLLSEMEAVLDGDLARLPDQSINDFKAGGATSLVSAVLQKGMRRFIGIWRRLQEEHERGNAALEEELHKLHQLQEGIK
jgi:hypothetical protein